ncbi:MAG: type 1 glutamine amidotransferase [Verrucomicrobiota bacterium]
MPNILVLKHVPYEGPAMIRDWATAAGCDIAEHHWYQIPQAPTSLPEHLIIMGGPMNVDDEQAHPWLAAEKVYIRQAIAADIPVLGICLGAQLIAAALGKHVFPNPHQELGWLPLSRTDAASQNPVLSAFPDQLPVFHWHGDTFELPDGATLLGSTEGCINQGFAIEKCIGLQFHIEISHSVIKELINDTRLPDWSGPYISQPKDILSGAEYHQASCKDTLFDLLDRWFKF